MASSYNTIQPRRDGILASLAIFAVAAIASVAVYMSAASAMKQEIHSSLLGLAQSAANLVDTAKQQQLTAANQKGNDTYNAVMAPYKAMMAGDPNLADIYTLVADDQSKIHFVIDTQVPGAQDTAGLMEVYDGASPVLVKAFADKKAVVEDKPYSDKWGTVLSAYAPYFDSNHNFLGMAGVDLRVDQYNARLNAIRVALMIGLSIATLCAVVCGFGVFAMRRAMLSAEIKAQKQQAELALMEAQRLETQAAAEAGAAAARKQAMRELADNFEQSVHGVLKEVVSAAAILQNESIKVSTIAEDTKDRSSAVSRISNDAAQTSSQVAAASEELTASIAEIRSQTERSNQVVRSAADKGAAAKEVIERLSVSSGRIGDVVNVINDIAGQINLLALNATIESARAGDAGKGFAVVANEVKSLSSQVSRALGEISHQVHDIQTETRLSVEAMGDILNIINDVTESTVIVASAVSQQSDVTREISHNIHATAHGAREIADNMVSVLSSADETGITAQRVQTATARLQAQSEDLNNEVDAFLKRVRA